MYLSRFRPSVELLEDRTLPAIFTVNVTHDLVNDLGDPADRSLREAILAANANPGLDTIAFAIPGAGPHTIQPTAALPDITDAVIIDGSTQPGFAGSPVIELDGSLAGNRVNGLSILAGGSTVRGLVINRFQGNGIKLETGDGNVIEGNYLGTDVTGTVALARHGFSVAIYSNHNRIGTDGDGVNDLAEQNLLAFGVGGGAFAFQFSPDTGDESRLGADDNVVAGNFIGIDVTGTSALFQPGEFDETFGVALEGSRNRIGTNGEGLSDDAERNVIAGFVNGIMLLGDDNVVAGNFVGTDATGTQALGNTRGVVITQGHRNRIGTNGDGLADAAERNIISGNKSYGVLISGDTIPSAEPPITSNNVVAGNYIGTDVSGTQALGNRTGIGVLNANLNRIGTNGDGMADAAESNLISGNVAGIIVGHIFDNIRVVYQRLVLNAEPPRPDAPTLDARHTLKNEIAGNRIGTDASGTAALGNGIGLYVRAHENRIGTDGNGLADAAEGNVISGNGEGIYIRGRRNVLAGNAIGVDAAGAALGNGNYDDLPMCPDHPPDQFCTLAQTRSHAILYDFREGVWGTYFHDDVSEFLLVADPFELAIRYQPLAGPGAERGTGVIVAGMHNVIGGEGSRGNTIAFNSGAGVAVRPARIFLGVAPQYFNGFREGFEQTFPPIPKGNTIRGNSIHDNGALGIDLAGDLDGAGVTFNVDGGPGNKLQNFPILTHVQRGASTRVVGALHSAANATFTLDFYASAAGDPSGLGEGQRYLGAAVVTTGADGSVEFDVLLAATGAGEMVTATATDTEGNTSEFSFAAHGTVSAQIVAGRLVIRGDGGRQAVQIAPGAAGSGSYLVTDVNGTRAFRAMKGLDIDLGGSADVALLTGAARPLQVAGALEVRTGADDDALVLNRVWALGPAVLDSGPGDDLVKTLAATFHRDVTVLAGLGMDRIVLDAVRARGHVWIDSAGGDDDVALRFSHFRGPVRVHAGSGDDLFSILRAHFADDVTVATAAGRDRLRLVDASIRGRTDLDTGAGADEIMIMGGAAFAANGRDIVHARFQGDLHIRTGAGADRVGIGIVGEDYDRDLVFPAAPMMERNTHIDTGDGNDAVAVQNSRFARNLTVHTGAGADVVSLRAGFDIDSSAPLAVAVVGRTDIDTGPGSDGVELEWVTLRGLVAVHTGQGTDEVRFSFSRFLQPVLIHAGAGADGVVINHSIFRGAVWIGLDAGHDQLLIDDYDPELRATTFFEPVEVWLGAERDEVQFSRGVVFRKGVFVRRSSSAFVS